MACRPAVHVKLKAVFIESMECLPVPALPEGPDWTYEIKLDGFRLEAIKSGREVTLYSRRGNVLNHKFDYIAKALAKLDAQTIIDGEVVAMDEDGVSDFSLLQNFRSAASQIHYFAFDILMHRGRSLLTKPLAERRALLSKVLPIHEQVSLSVVDRRAPAHLLKFIRSHGMEGVIAKRADAAYEPGKRSGLWQKHRLNRGQEFVVGGYTPGTHGFDALIVGVYQGKELRFVARVRAGFVPAIRKIVFDKLKRVGKSRCPFVNLPQATPGRWGQGLTAEKMRDCVWIKPEVVVQVDFLQWTSGEMLRHTRFIALREDKTARSVVRET